MTICNSYLYPNTGGSVGRRGQLKHASLCSIRQREVVDGVIPGNQLPQVITGGVTTYTHKMIDVSWRKQFQFNPPDLGISLQNVNTNPPGTDTQGGAWGNAMGPGLATTRLDLFFDRQQEVYRHNVRGDAVWGVPWKDIGVAKDVYDVYSVLLGANSTRDYEAQSSGSTTIFEGGVPEDQIDDTTSSVQSISNLTSKFFDLAGGGIANFIYAPVAVVYNSNLAIYGQVTSMAFTFTRFNRLLVPVTASVSLEIEITNIGSKAAPPVTYTTGSSLATANQTGTDANPLLGTNSSTNGSSSDTSASGGTISRSYRGQGGVILS